MPTITLHATGDVAGGLGTPTVVGSAPQWGDGSDSTYATAASSSTYMVSALEVLTLPAGATVTAVRASVRAVAGGANTLGDFSLNSDSGFGTGFACYFDPTGSGINTTLTGSVADYDLLQSSHSLSQDPVTVLSAGAWVGAKLDGATAGSLTVYEFTVFVDYDTAEVETPCDTTVDLDLSMATLQSGQYVDGVITGLSGTNAQFWFPFEVEPAKRYLVTVTFDPGSAHDGDGDPTTSDRFVLIYDAVADDEGTTGVQVYDGFSNTDDVTTFTIGPGIGNWDDPDQGVAQGFTRLLFQTSASGAVSAISIRKICTTFAPPLRLTNRDDMFASARRLTGGSSRQGSNRLTGYL